MTSPDSEPTIQELVTDINVLWNGAPDASDNVLSALAKIIALGKQSGVKSASEPASLVQEEVYADGEDDTPLAEVAESQPEKAVHVETIPEHAGYIAVESEMDGTKLEDLERSVLRYRRQAKIIQNYTAAFNDDGTALLGDDFQTRDHQPRIFSRIGDKLRGGPDENGAVIVALRAAPNVGKTIIAVKAVEAMVTDDTPEGGPYQVLHLVPDLTNARQTMGTENKGYKAFVPDLRVGQYFDGVKEYNDVTVMTYRSLTFMKDDEFRELLGRLDITVADEVHRAYGEKISARMKQLIGREGMTFLAMSATTEFNEERTLSSELGIAELADNIGFRESIEDGIGNSVQVILLSTSSKVEISHSKHVAAEDIRHLIAEKSRNMLTLDVIQTMAEEGRTGLVKCIRGGNSLHARNLAREAADRTITDPATGEQRRLRVTAVGSFQSADKNARTLQEFKDGKWDALTFCRYLIEGYDEDRVEYVLDIEPTVSQVDTDQLFGRGLRIKDKITLYFQLIDSYSGRGTRVRTFLDTVDQETYNPDVVIGKRRRIGTRWSKYSGADTDKAPANEGPTGTITPTNSHERSKGGSSAGAIVPTPRNAMEAAALNYIDLPLSLRRAIEPMIGRQVAELTLIAKKYEAAPENWVPLNGISLNKHFSMPTIMRIVQDRGIELRKGPSGQFFVPPDIEELVKGAEGKDADDTVVSLANFRKVTGISFDLFNKMVGELDITPIMMHTRNKTRRPGWHIGVADAGRILAHLESNFPPIDPAVEMGIPEIADKLYRNRTQIRIVAAKMRIPTHTKFGRTRRETDCLTLKDAELLMTELGVLIPEDAITFKFLSTKLGISVDKLRSSVDKSPFAESVEGGLLRGGTSVQWLRAEHAESFIAWYRDNE